jgi:protein SCO1
MAFKRLVVQLLIAASGVSASYFNGGSCLALAHNGLAAEGGVENELPKQLNNVGITEHLGDSVDLNLKFKDETGAVVPLRSFFKGHKPVLLSLAYYSCPSLCNFHLNGLNDAFKKMKNPVGTDFEFVVISIEPKETPALAARKKEAYLNAYGRTEGNSGWHFLVGDQDQIAQLAKQVGFNYHWDAKENQYAHASAAYMLTPEGRISRYLYGIVFDPETLRLSAIESSSGKIGTIVDRLILFCFHYDPSGSKYTLYAFNMVRIGGALMIAVLAAFLIPFWLRSRRETFRGES